MAYAWWTTRLLFCVFLWSTVEHICVVALSPISLMSLSKEQLVSEVMRLDDELTVTQCKCECESQCQCSASASQCLNYCEQWCTIIPLPTTTVHPTNPVTDCYDWLHVEGKTTSGIYKISPPGIEPFDVYCDMETDGGGWTVFQRQVDDSLNFGGRPWMDFKNGFNNGLSRNSFLGLDRVHALSTKDPIVDLRIDIWGNRCKSTADCGSWFIPGFENAYWFGEWAFSVEDEINKYRLHVAPVRAGNLSHPAQDWLLSNDKQAFTTIDRDNDQYATGNCATFDPVRKGAWWFNACSWYRLLDSAMFLYRSGSADCSPKEACYIIVPKQTAMKLRKRR